MRWTARSVHRLGERTIIELVPRGHWIPFHGEYLHIRASSADKVQKEDPDTELADYADRTVHVVVSVFRCALATLFPALGMVILYVVDTIAAKFALIFVFTACFTLAISLLTLAKTVEIFIAATTYVGKSLILRGVYVCTNAS